MAKQLNVNLAFTADTSKAKAQIQDLQNQLTKVINQPTSGLGSDMANKINQASRAAAELKVHLEQAMNPKTGTLDFSKLNQSLQKSGISLNTYAAKLKEIGPEGQKAFSMLAQSVASAEVPIRRSNALLSELWVTMKNTARWQLTSSVLHGFIGALQSAHGYAKDLNESLNDIRIVTGNSVDQMADFAKEANKAAKALSTSTVNYTNAALIYYQQGLDEQQVKERTDITIKMANVSKQSAEIVSDQLTAVWNNFYDGSQSLEHFADVMTRLGADTASSSDEIAQGLEKFAAIGEMIGLSFDNAAAALATVTATTRQSADVVGTAFKTIFARIQGLNLGETLEDGTTLNKYSDALNKVGISIFEQNGELKDMDNILAEMGAKWKTLSKDQQVALAQTVAGVRQYNQLVALMDNYDFYEKNLFSAQNAEGSLNEQADIYEESWQAASDRVKASLEEIYDALLNDEAFINLLDNIAKIINGFDAIIDSVGGLKGVLASVAVIIGKLKFDSIVSGIQGTAYNIRNTFDGGKAMRQQKVNTLQDMITTPEDPDAGLSIIESTNNEVITAQLKSQQFLIDNVKKLSVEEQKVLQILMDQQTERSKQAMTAAEAAQSAETRFDEASVIMTGYVGVNATDRKSIYTKAKALGELESNGDNSREAKIQAQQLQKQIDDEIDLISKKNHLSKKETEYLRASSVAAKEKVKTKATLNKTTAEATREINKESIAQEKETQKKKEAEQAERKLKAAKDAGITSSEKSQKKLSISAAGFVNGSMAALSMVSAISMLGSAFDTLHDPDLSPWEKFSSISMSLMFTLPMLKNSIKSLNAVIGIDLGLVRSLIAAYMAQNALLKEEASLTFINNAAKKILNAQDQARVVNMFATVAVKKGLLAEEQKEAFITTVLTKLKKAENAEDVKSILLDTLRGSSTKKLNGQLLNQVKNLLLKNAALLKYIAIAALVAAAIWLIVRASQAEERALKSAKDGVKNATEAYRELQQSYEDLKKSIEDYQSAYKAFKELEKGAEGYQEALEKANDAARDLIEANNLFDDWYYDENGAIVFKEGSLDNALEESNRKVAGASLNAQAANLKYIETQKDIAQPWYLSDSQTNLLANTSEEVFSTIKQAVDRGLTSSLNAEALGLSLSQLNNLIIAISDLGNKAESTYNQLKQLNSQEEYYGEQFALSAAQSNNIYGAKGEENLQKAYANLISQDENYQEQLRKNADKAKKATDGELKRVMRELNADKSDALMNKATSWGFSDEELIRLYMRDVKGWSEQDASAAVYKKGNGKGTLTLGDQSFEYNDQQMRNELYTKYLADQMAQNMGTNGNDIAIREILDQVAKVSDESANNGVTSDGENELINALMNFQEGSTLVVDWAQLTPEEYADFSKQVAEMAKDNGNTYAEAFNATLVSAEEQKRMYENAQRQKEAAEIEAIFAEGAAATEISTAALESYAEALIDANTPLADQKVLAAKVAVEHAKLGKGLNKVQKIYNDNIDILKEADEASMDYHEAVGELSEALSETFGMEVSPSFVKNAENLENIRKAAEGDVEALKALRIALNEDFVAKLELQTEGAGQDLINFLNTASEQAAKAPIGTTIELDNSGAIAAINEALYTGKATIEDIEAMFNNANLAMPEYKTTTVPGEVVHTTSTAHYKGPLGIEWDVTSETDTSTDRVIPYFGDTPPSLDSSGNMNYGGGGLTNFTTQSNNTSLDNALDYEGDDGEKSGGKKYKPEIDRYHEINKEIEKQEKALKRLSKAKDDAFGASKLSAIDAEIQGIKNLKAANEELYRQQQEKLNEDAGALMALFPEADISNGYIANYNDLLMKTTTEDQKKILDQYEQTWSAVNDTYYKLLDFDDQVKDLNYEKLSYTVELNIDLNDSELQMLELKLKSYEDNFYKMSETAAIMRDQGKLYEEALGHYENGWKSYQSAYEAGDITQEKYIDGLKNARDGMYSQLEALIDLDKEMMHFYEDTLASAQEEMESFTDHMEHLTGVFDHYLNLMDILGKSKDYEAMDDFLMGRADTIRDRLDTAKSYYDMLLEQKAQVEQKLNAAIASGDDAAAELYKEEWDAIVTATDEAQEEVLGLTEEWAEAMKEAIEKRMEKITDTLEKALTKGLGFENLMDNFDKLNTQQEEFLTKTNQIYETNKMMRAANKALDETDNKVAKQKLKNFISETQNLQENNRLSKVELEIQQAKYDLLLAEIALEEAQNAKSTVRLSRDSEGNFGYVYTADENEVAEAEQAVDDADNNLYNLSLEKQQEYTEKYIQAQEQMFNELTQLHEDYMAGLITDEEFEIRRQTIEKYYLGSAEYNAALELLNEQYRNGQITSEEEYNAKKQALMEQYQGETGILTEYSNLYNIAVQGHAAATQENWQKEYGLMTQNTSDWKDAVDQYLLDIQEQTNNWKDVSVQANSDVKGALDNSKLATQQLTDESNKLKNKLLTEVIPALRTELTDVNNLTTAYGNERDAIQGVIQKYSEYIAIMNKAIQTAAKVPDDKGGGTKPPTPTPTQKPTTTTTTTTTQKPTTTTTQKPSTTTTTSGTSTQTTDDKKDEPPTSAFNVGDKIKIADNNGFTYYYTKSGNTITKSTGTRATLFGMEWTTKLGTVKDKFYNEADGRWYYQSSEYPGEWYNGWAIKKYDTGGYTGDWGPEGKLAVLHQKELVLNADDTENILASVNFVRDIMKSIDQQAAWASNGLGLLTASGYGNAGGGTLEQTVTIHAEFPNATNHSEIEEAFNNLVNRATQYANRK